MSALPSAKNLEADAGTELSALREWLLGTKPDSVHSFDIFDTAVTRIWRRPSDLFLALGRELAGSGRIAVRPAVFAEARRSAEAIARSSEPSGETTLAEIYGHVARKIGLPAEEAAGLAAAEVAIETRSMRPIGPVAAAIRRLAAEGRRVVMTSDTYLTSADVAPILAASGLDPSKLDLILSSEHHASKRKGDLFEAVSAIRPGVSATHFGDRKVADLENSRAAGLDGRQFLGEAETKREAGLAAGGWSDPLAASAAAGSARAARLTGESEAANLSTFRSVGAAVAGPLLAAYVAWVLRSAEEAGIQRLLFLARDGQILHELASRIGHVIRTSVECRYTYASRQALYLPAVRAVGDTAWGWLAAKMEGRRVDQVLKRFGLEPSILAEAGDSDGISASAIVDARLAERLGSWLASGPVAERALGNAAQRRALTRSYYAREIGSTGRVAIVDMGWKGRLQVCLERVLDPESGEKATKLDGYYFALDGTAAIPVHGKRLAFTDYRKLPNTVLLECLTQADHGSLLGFRQADGDVVPVLGDGEEELDPIIHELQAAALAFTDNFLTGSGIGRFDLGQALAELKRPALGAYDDFVESPSLAEAVAFGELEHSDDQAHQAASRIAPPLSLKGLWTLLRFGPARAGERLTYWPQASVRRMGAENPVLRVGLKAVGPLRGMVGRSLSLARQVKRRLQGRPRNLAKPGERPAPVNIGRE